MKSLILFSVLIFTISTAIAGKGDAGGGEILRTRFNLGLDRAIISVSKLTQLDGGFIPADEADAKIFPEALKAEYIAIRTNLLKGLSQLKQKQIDVKPSDLTNAKVYELFEDKIILSLQAFANQGLTTDDAMMAALELSASLIQLKTPAEEFAKISKALAVQSVRKGLIEGISPEDLGQYVNTGKNIVVSLEEYGKEPLLVDLKFVDEDNYRNRDYPEIVTERIGIELEVRQLFFNSLKEYQALWAISMAGTGPVVMARPQLCFNSIEEITATKMVRDLVCMNEKKKIDRHKMYLLNVLFQQKLKSHFMGRIGWGAAPLPLNSFYYDLYSDEVNMSYIFRKIYLGNTSRFSKLFGPSRLNDRLLDYSRAARHRIIRLLESVPQLDAESKYATVYAQYRQALLKQAKEINSSFYHGITFKDQIFDKRNGVDIEVAATTVDEEIIEYSTGFLGKTSEKVSTKKAIALNTNYFAKLYQPSDRHHLLNYEERAEFTLLLLHEIGHLAGITEQNFGEDVHDMLDKMGLEILKAFKK